MLGFFQRYRKNLKILDSLDFIGFLHTHVYVCHIRSLEYDKKILCNNSKVKYSERRFYNLLYFIQTLRKKNTIRSIKTNNNQWQKDAQETPPPRIMRVGLLLPFLWELLLHPCLDFKPSFPGLSAGSPAPRPPK